MKLCKDCKHCRVLWIDRIIMFRRPHEFAECRRIIPMRRAEELVDGKTSIMEPDIVGYCSIEREYEPPIGCGKEAEYFEPK